MAGALVRGIQSRRDAIASHDPGASHIQHEEKVDGCRD
jgi:hypothetical protein